MYSKSAKEWVVKHIYERKTCNYISKLIDLALTARRDGLTLQGSEEPRSALPVSIAPTPAPPLEELLAKRRRMAR